MIKLVNVSKYYNSNNVIALGLRKVNLELHVNEFVAIVGESGSGKTTLLNVISGIDSYEDGEMYINGEETSYFSIDEMENYRKKYIAFVFQSYNLIDSYTVLQNVEAPLILSGYPKDQIRSRALEIIKRVGLEKHIHHKATKLSGGQKQRVVIARALAKDCPIIAADEPTGNLDSVSARQILELLHEISKEKLVIMVTHDFEQVKEFATRKIRIFDGEVVEDHELTKVDKQSLPVIPDAERKIKFFDFVKLAFRNLFSVPKKTFLMVIVFSFFAFFVSLAYGSFNINFSDFSYNYNYYFENTSSSRMIVRKSDKTPFTPADLLELEGLNKVQTLIPFDYLLDSSNWLMSDVLPGDTYERTYLSGTYLPSTVVPEGMALAYGELPTNSQQIAVAVSSDRVEELSRYLNTQFYNEVYYEGQDSGQNDSLELVGILSAPDIYMDLTNSYSGAYIIVDEDTFIEKSRLSYFKFVSGAEFSGLDADSQPINIAFQNAQEIMFTVDNTLPDDYVTIPSFMAYGLCDKEEDTCEATGSFSFSDFYTTSEVDNITIEYGFDNLRDYKFQNEFMRMNSNTLAKMVYDEIYQVSVIANTDLNVNTLVKEINQIDKTILTSKYKVFYPYDSKNNDEFSGLLLLLQTIGMVLLLVVTLFGATLITYVIFRAIINTKLHDYAIFRTIGANQKMIKNFIYLENVFVVLISFVLFLGLSFYLKMSSSVGGIFYSLKGYTFVDFVVFFGLLIIMSLIISRKYCQRVFGESVNKVLKAE